MIRVAPQPEPDHFDARVRQPGLRSLAEMRGESGLPPRRGRPRTVRAEIRPEDLTDYWRHCLDDLHAVYRGICAYACFHIEPVTGFRTVDHFVARYSARPEDAYEWANYRLACGLMNARKHQFADVLDPFAIHDGWFQIEFFDCQVKPANDLDPATRDRVVDTIERLGLNEPPMPRQRRQYVEEYQERHIDFDYLTRRAPFVAMEMERQNLVTHRGPLW